MVTHRRSDELSLSNTASPADHDCSGRASRKRRSRNSADLGQIKLQGTPARRVFVKAYEVTAMAKTTWQNNISTNLPAEAKPSNIIDLLHDHAFLITMSPIVSRYQEAHRDGDKVTYDVWEHIDLLPFGLWKREIQFTAAFQNTETGVVTWIEAPMGLTSRATYAVKPASDKTDSPNGSHFLDESIESACNVLLKTFVESTMVATRKKMHLRILEKAR